MNVKELTDTLRTRHNSLKGDRFQLQPDASLLNVSHIINTLRFGPTYPGLVRGRGRAHGSWARRPVGTSPFCASLAPKMQRETVRGTHDSTYN
jgi:hypothetical protein